MGQFHFVIQNAEVELHFSPCTQVRNQRVSNQSQSSIEGAGEKAINRPENFFCLPECGIGLPQKYNLCPLQAEIAGYSAKVPVPNRFQNVQGRGSKNQNFTVFQSRGSRFFS